ncbi:hypothetical protein PMIN04_011209 [Paraphaeosphaeria minitans]
MTSSMTSTSVMARHQGSKVCHRRHAHHQLTTVTARRSSQKLFVQLAAISLLGHTQTSFNSSKSPFFAERCDDSRTRNITPRPLSYLFAPFAVSKDTHRILQAFERCITNLAYDDQAARRLRLVDGPGE